MARVVARRLGPMTVAIAHDYLTQKGGAERVVLEMARAFPDAPIYTTLYDPEKTFPEFRDRDIRVSWLNKISFFRKNHRLALPLLPLAVQSLQIDADVAVISSSGWAHGMPGAKARLVYCYTPARWLYQADRYLANRPRWQVRIATTVMAPLRLWDKRVAKREQKYLAISSVTRDRIRECYGMEVPVVPAPFSINLAALQEMPPKLTGFASDRQYFLCVARLLPYKNVDKVVSAFRGRADKLVVVGAGPELARLEAAAPANILFMQGIPDHHLRWLIAHCQATVSASFEDFGLGPIEAAAYGRPSIVLRWGGFLDTVVEGETGIFFDEPSRESLSQALDRFGDMAWNSDLIRRHAEQFSGGVFRDRLVSEVNLLWTRA